MFVRVYTQDDVDLGFLNLDRVDLANPVTDPTDPTKRALEVTQGTVKRTLRISNSTYADLLDAMNRSIY